MGSNAAISSDIKRAIASKGFIFGTLGMVLVIALSSLEAIITLTRFAHPLQNGYHAQFIMDALASDWFTLALPILCALQSLNPHIYRHRIGVGRGSFLSL